ncbi:TetR/AcrR family transcriptional regulator [Mycobacterium syngnathidarum]
MPRPSKPLIRRHAAAEAALRIIDMEGLDALSLFRLARELNVQAPSLYHHFEDKAEILKEVARFIVSSTRVPDPKSVPNWIEWYVALCLALRHAILEHRNAAPVLVRFVPSDLLLRTYNISADYMKSIGLSDDQVILVLDGLEKLTLGAGVTEASHGDDGRLFAKADPETEPQLARAVAANRRSPATVFAEAVRSFLRGAAPDVPASAPPPTDWPNLVSPHDDGARASSGS